MKLILNPAEKMVLLLDDKGNLVENFLVLEKFPQILFIKLKYEETFNAYRLTFSKKCGIDKVPGFIYKHKGLEITTTEQKVINILEDEKIDQYFFIPADFLKPYNT